MAADLTHYAQIGYQGDTEWSALYTSPAHSAYALGAFFRATCRTMPRDVRMGRGDSIRANDMRFAIDYRSVKHPAFDRIE